MVAMGPLEPYCSGSHPSPKMQAQTEYACEECLVQLPPPPPPKGIPWANGPVKMAIWR